MPSALSVLISDALVYRPGDLDQLSITRLPVAVSGWPTVKVGTALAGISSLSSSSISAATPYARQPLDLMTRPTALNSSPSPSSFARRTL